jgi:hypothetical protein
LLPDTVSADSIWANEVTRVTAAMNPAAPNINPADELPTNPVFVGLVEE